ncbi:MAG: hypothetical protein ACRDHU_01770 [Actinomycetota bacterium]
MESLKVRFTEFVNRLLEAEAASGGLAGHQLAVTMKETTPDGGVDAALRSAEETNWIPPGDSAWQFKRSDLGPQACADEIDGALWAHEYIRQGGSYVLALGADLNDQQIHDRRGRIATKLIELGLLQHDDPHRIRVYDANTLARWASRFPSLAVSPLLGGPGGGLIDFARWASSRRHQLHWMGTEDRTRHIETIRETVEDSTKGEIHVDGPSGIGKTRLVMEALRSDGLSPLVAYVADAESLSDEVLGHVLGPERSVILVVDECPGRRHDKVAERLPSTSMLRLVTIGEPDTHALLAPVLHVTAMQPSDVEGFLKENYPQLSVEARRLVSGQCAGNVRFAIVLVERLLELGPAQAADLVRRNDLEEITRVLMPEGRPFFLATLLALFERVGWEGDLGHQMERLATFADVDVRELREVGQEMEHRGLMVRQGRYRAIAPHPLAVVLAADAWSGFGERIVNELLPGLDREMTLSLLTRAGDLGRYEPARRVLVTLLGSHGLFGTLASIEEHELGRFLTQLAIVAPEETMDYLGPRIQEASLEELRAQTRSRRDLVWTLEKLAWHRTTFERAADSLLRLALAENENYGNNATGTWVALFGVALPATAALPDERISYLAERSRSASDEIRGLVIKACGSALHPYETVGVSGELQGGAYVDRRGGVQSWEEMAEYRSALLDILGELSSDESADNAKSASDTLIDAVLPLIDVPVVSQKLISILAELPSGAQEKLWQEVERLRGMMQRTERGIASGLDQLVDALPGRRLIDELRTLLTVEPWDLQDGDLRARFDAAVDEVVATGGADEVLGWLATEPFQSSWFLGHGLAAHEDEIGDLRPRLVPVVDRNLPALAGYLSGQVEAGKEHSFDELLDSKTAQTLKPAEVLAITIRGPVSIRAKERVFELMGQLPVGEGAYGLFGWQGNFSEDELERLMNEWLPRVDSQQGYNAVIDWLALWLHPDKTIPDPLRLRVFELLKRRIEYRDLANARWDWSTLAKRFLETDPVEVALVILDLVDEGELIGLGHHDEGELLTEAARRKPDEIWAEVGRRIEEGHWRMSMSLSGWFTSAVSVEVICDWIGGSRERARLVASITDPGQAAPTELARHLLKTFGDDPDVKSDLAMEFRSGSWTGPESAHLLDQIQQLEGWLRADEPAEVRTWASEVIGYLKRERDRALQREAEERW